MTDLVSYFRKRRASILEQIQSLVELESPTLDPRATTTLTNQLAAQLRRVGATVTLHRGAAGAHLSAQVSDGLSNGKSPVMLLGHVDTVWPRGTLARRPFRIENGRAHGPGIFDMKSGLVLMLEALSAIKTLQLQLTRPVKLFLSCDEESGSRTSRDLIEAEAANCAAVLVFEPPLPGGVAKTERKGVASYRLIVRGVAAHAGVEPDKGVSAIVEMAHQIVAINRLNDPGAGITINVGVVSGGSSANVIASEARADFDVRFRTTVQGEALMKRIRELSPIHKKSRFELSGGLNRPPLERSAAVIALFEQARRLAAELDFELGEGSTGGASDGNFTAALGIPTLDGLGVDGEGAHAEHEHILVDDIPKRAALLVRLLTTL